jgi:hypothetical protein
VKVKTKINEGWFYDECYRANINIIWPVNPDQLSAYIKKRFKIDYAKEEIFGGRAIEIEKDGYTQGDMLIALSNWKNTPDWLACLAHECNHLTNWILWRRGMKCLPESEEAFCYLHESIFRRCLEQLNKKK